MERNYRKIMLDNREKFIDEIVENNYGVPLVICGLGPQAIKFSFEAPLEGIIEDSEELAFCWGPHTKIGPRMKEFVDKIIPPTEDENTTSTKSIDAEERKKQLRAKLKAHKEGKN